MTVNTIFETLGRNVDDLPQTSSAIKSLEHIGIPADEISDSGQYRIARIAVAEEVMLGHIEKTEAKSVYWLVHSALAETALR